MSISFSHYVNFFFHWACITQEMHLEIFNVRMYCKMYHTGECKCILNHSRIFWITMVIFQQCLCIYRFYKYKPNKSFKDTNWFQNGLDYEFYFFVEFEPCLMGQILILHGNIVCVGGPGLFFQTQQIRLKLSIHM